MINIPTPEEDGYVSYDPYIEPFMLYLKDKVEEFSNRPNMATNSSILANALIGTPNDEYRDYGLNAMYKLCEKAIDNTTAEFAATQTVSSNVFTSIYCLLAIFSIIGLIIVALSIFYNKELRQHP